MKRSRFTEEQIIAILKEHELGAKTADQYRKHGISEATIYNWKAKFGGLDVSEGKRLRVSYKISYGKLVFNTPQLTRGTVYHPEKVLGMLPIIMTLDNVLAGVQSKITIAVVAPLPFLQIAL